MPIKIFPDAPPAPTPPPKEQLLRQTVNQIHRTDSRCGGQMRESYHSILGLIHANPHGLTAEDIYAELSEDEAQLQLLAVILKTALNTVEPGAIVDAVPEAKITL